MELQGSSKRNLFAVLQLKKKQMRKEEIVSNPLYEST